MIKLEPISHYKVIFSEKKDGSFETENQILDVCQTISPQTSFFYFHHQHQAQRLLASPQTKNQQIWADAAISKHKKTGLAMKVADCFPLLLAVPGKNIFCLIHAGWKPLLQNVIELTVQDLQLHYQIRPEQLTAWIGPGVRGCCYQFEQKPLQADLKSWQAAVIERTLSEQKLQWVIDLPKFIKQELIRLGLKRKQILDEGSCTYCQPQTFFSHRRSQQDRNEPEGRQLVAAWTD